MDNRLDDADCWQKAYCGTARIALEDLRPLRIIADERSLDPPKIKRLADIFQIAGCDKFRDGHRLRSTITRRTWVHLEPIVNNCRGRLLRLQGRQKIAYLHGRHRLAAAYSLLPAERWWVVDFYRRELIPDRELAIAIHDFDNNTAYNDGTIFRNLRYGDTAAGSEWMSRLGPSKRRDLQQLWGGKPQMRHLSNAFDRLVDAEGLWQGFKIGTFHRLLPMQATEELISKLDDLYGSWSYILGLNDDTLPLPFIDAYTVQQLQGRSPYCSQADARFLRQAFDNQMVFNWLPPFQRAQVQQRCLNFTGIIPSLHTFLEDTKWLEPSSKALRALFPRSRRTIRFNLARHFPNPQGDPLAFMRAYRRIWLCSQRHFPELGPVQPRLNKRSSDMMQCRKLSADEAQNILFDEAIDAGFVLNGQRPLDTLHYHETAPLPDPALSTEFEPVFKLRHRCGRMFQGAFEESKPYMYLEKVYDGRLTTGPDISSFAVFRNTFHGFFGDASCQALKILDEQTDGDHLYNVGALAESTQHIVAQGWFRAEDNAEGAQAPQEAHGSTVPSNSQGQNGEPYLSAAEIPRSAAPLASAVNALMLHTSITSAPAQNVSTTLPAAPLASAQNELVLHNPVTSAPTRSMASLSTTPLASVQNELVLHNPVASQSTAPLASTQNELVLYNSIASAPAQSISTSPSTAPLASAQNALVLHDPVASSAAHETSVANTTGPMASISSQPMLMTSQNMSANKDAEDSEMPDAEGLDASPRVTQHPHSPVTQLSKYLSRLKAAGHKGPVLLIVTRSGAHEIRQHVRQRLANLYTGPNWAQFQVLWDEGAENFKLYPCDGWPQGIAYVVAMRKGAATMGNVIPFFSQQRSRPTQPPESMAVDDPFEDIE